MRKPKTLEQLNAIAVKLQPNDNKAVNSDGKGYLFYLPPVKQRFARKNDVFTWGINGIWYVCPFFKGLLQILQTNDIYETRFFVPFSNGYHPFNHKNEWRNLLRTCKRWS